jgi:hypothetical protein
MSIIVIVICHLYHPNSFSYPGRVCVFVRVRVFVFLCVCARRTSNYSLNCLHLFITFLA